MTYTALELNQDEVILLLTLFDGAMLDDAPKNSTYQKLSFLKATFEKFENKNEPSEWIKRKIA